MNSKELREIESMLLNPFHDETLTCILGEKEYNGKKHRTLIYKSFACTCANENKEAYKVGLSELLKEENLERDIFTTSMVHLMTSLNWEITFASDMWCGIYTKGHHIEFEIQCDVIDYGLVLLYYSVKAVLGTLWSDVAAEAKVEELMQQAQLGEIND